MPEQPFHTIEEAIEEIRLGKMIIVVDDEDRENEGDFLMAAEMASPESVNFMAKHGRGLICVPVTRSRATDLDLNYMVTEGADPNEAAFTISVDHKELTTTGISASDRANTIRAMIRDGVTADEFRRPGHVFPLIGARGGVLRRAGHTEAAIDLARLAGLKPAGVICEIMRDDGEMARLPELIEIARDFDLKLVTIKDLIAYRMKHESLVSKRSSTHLPTIYGDFTLHAFQEITTEDTHLALTKGDWTEEDPVLVRVHSSNPLGDIFGSKRSDKTGLLHQTLRMVEEAGQGVVLYMDQMTRNRMILHQLKSLELQDQGFSLEEIRQQLGNPMDYRDYGVGAQILHQLGVRKLRLLTNNPVKRVGLRSFGLEMVGEVAIPVDHLNLDHPDDKLDKPDDQGNSFIKNLMLE
ncbi:MAG: 3,4-dihydroxy-2-butanone-4-phosphate synthase [Balneolaceae bacterium]